MLLPGFYTKPGKEISHSGSQAPRLIPDQYRTHSVVQVSDVGG